MVEPIDTIVSLNYLFAVCDRCSFLSLEIISWHAHLTDIATMFMLKNIFVLNFYLRESNL